MDIEEENANTNDPVCIICKENFSNANPRVSVGDKGLQSMVNACKIKREFELLKFIEDILVSGSCNISVHNNCRKLLTDRRTKYRDSTNDEEKTAKRMKTRSLTNPFDWKTDCVFCGNGCFIDNRTKVSFVKTLQLRENILDVCRNNKDDSLSEIQHRVENCDDMVHVEAVYHRDCIVTFFSLSRGCGSSSTVKENRGRPKNQSIDDSFEKACEWLELNPEPKTIKEIQEKMKYINGEGDSWSPKWLKKKLIEKYGNNITITSDGYKNIVCLTDMANRIINDTWYNGRKGNIEEESSRIILTAAKLINAQIREMKFNTDTYPSDESIASMEEGEKWLPQSLVMFLDVIIYSKIKRNSIGMCIVHAARPQSSLPPIPFGLGVEIDHVFGSKWLVDQMSRLGFSITHDEVRRYKQSVLQVEDVEDNIPSNSTFVQWSADNADHNVASIDGKNTFHGMGVIASVTSTDHNIVSPSQPIPRQKRLPVQEIIEDKGIPIVKYISPIKPAIAAYVFKPRKELLYPYTPIPECIYDLLWHVGWQFVSDNVQHPNWSGFMHNVKSEYCPDTSDIYLLPLIDLNPSDESCVYSTLVYVKEQAKKVNVKTPCVTFDQPLWIKAVSIIKWKKMEMVARLGGFHTLMSFLGSIGTLMSGSGLEEALGVMFAENVVPHLMSGKAFARAIRGHFIVEAALTKRLITNIFEEMNEDDVSRIKDLLQNVLRGDATKRDVIESEELQNLGVNLDCLKDSLQRNSRTAKLWLLYSSYIDTVKHYIRAERTGNWHLHLASTEKMLNLFAATGHVHYAKSARLYLQLMYELPDQYPWLYKMFTEGGYHTIRRSKRYWSGLWSDLVIEQTMMRSLKSKGGLTRGRGMTESVRHQWIHSMPRCASIHNAMTTLTNLMRNTCEQHEDMGGSRRKRDASDFANVSLWFDQHEPFDVNFCGLRSLSTGITTNENDTVNCDLAEEVGFEIQEHLDNMNAADAKIKRSNQIRPLASLYNNVKVGKNKKICIDPTTLFTRLIAIAQREDDIAKYFRYELTSMPMSLFKDGLMRYQDKSKLRHILIDEKVKETQPNNLSKHVLDGGALMHKVRWQKGETYKQTARRYAKYVNDHYGQCHVVFDGYDCTSTIKDEEHQRRSNNGKTSANIQILESNVIYDKQDAFLNNSHNKGQLVQLLTKYLKEAGNVVINSSEDADTMIVSCAIELARQMNSVVVVSDDTDVIFLLIYHLNEEMGDIYFCSQKASKTWKIQEIVSSLGPLLKQHLLVLHAWTGCDSTSTIYGHGKAGFLKKLLTSEEMQKHANVLSDPWATTEQVAEAGNQIFIIMYGGKKGMTLDKLRYVKYLEMTSSKSARIVPEKLPPTPRGATFHSLRVHLQVVIWKALDTSILEPTDWGWKQNNSKLSPIPTDLQIAPDHLQKFIRCKCSITSRKPCSTNTCSCLKNDLSCVPVCGDCRGEYCLNVNKDMIPGSQDHDDGNIFDILEGCL